MVFTIYFKIFTIFFRKITETYIIGTKAREWFWQTRGGKWINIDFEKNPHPHRKLLLEKISNHVPFNSVLEIGCANGPNLFFLANEFPKVKIQGIDINRKAIKIGNDYFKRKGISNVKLFIGKADDLSKFADKSFDIIFTDAILLYIAKDKINKVALEMKRVTRKAIVLLEHHSEDKDAFGFYNQGNWIRDYKKLFEPFSSEIKTTKLPLGIWGGDWEKFGYIIEIVL